MVNYTYVVKVRNLKTFIENAKRFFPDTLWDISLHDLTIKSKDIEYAVSRLKPRDDDQLTFEAEVWHGYTFINALPKVNFSVFKVSDEDRATLTEVAEKIAKCYHDSGMEVALHMEISFDWNKVKEIMTLVSERFPLDGYFYAASSNMIWLKKKNSSSLMFINKIDDKTIYTNCELEVIFDLDDGFVVPDYTGGDNHPAPKEMVDQFNQWVENDRQGPVLRI